MNRVLISQLMHDPTMRQFLRFIMIGVLNTAFGYAVFALLIWIGLPPQPALALAFVLGVMWNYFAHARYVFGAGGLARVPHYVLGYLVVYGFNALALKLLLSAGLASLVAQALLAPIAAVLSFFLIAKALTGRFPIFG